MISALASEVLRFIGLLPSLTCFATFTGTTSATLLSLTSTTCYITHGTFSEITRQYEPLSRHAIPAFWWMSFRIPIRCRPKSSGELQARAIQRGRGMSSLSALGALFLVGDPKQAIYRFRGADVHTYLLAKRALSDDAEAAILEVTANFRAKESILQYVNQQFKAMLAETQGQPGFTTLRAGDKISFRFQDGRMV